MNKKKKAQSGLQFNWIFVLIAGAMIIAMFVMIINKQQQKHTIEESYKLSRKINTLLTSIETSQTTVQEFNIPEANLIFICDDATSEYFIQEAGPISTKTKPLFTQESLKGQRIIAWTQKYVQPILYGTTMYLSNKKTLYAFITEQKQGGLIRYLYDKMPTEYSKALIIKKPGTNIERELLKGYEKYVIISEAGTELTGLTGKNKIKITIEGTKDQGKATINGEETSYAGEPMLWGIIFSENKESYDCNKKKIYEKIITVSKIIEKRNERLTQELGLSPCTGIISEGKRINKEIREAAEQENDEQLYNKQQELKELIDYSKRGFKCPPII